MWFWSAMKYCVIVHCLQDERLFDGAVHLLIYFMALVIQQKLWVSVWQVRNSRLVVLLSSICVCRCSVRHCQSFVKWLMSIHNRSAIPDTVLGACMCRVFLLALGKKKKSLLYCPLHIFLVVEKNQSLVGLKSLHAFSRRMLMRFRVWRRNCRTDEDIPWLYLMNSQPRK